MIQATSVRREDAATDMRVGGLGKREAIGAVSWPQGYSEAS